MKSGGKDDFDRGEIRFDPPAEPLVVDSRRSGVRGLDEIERDEGEPSGPTLEERMDAPGHLADLEDREREGAAGTDAGATPAPPPPDAQADPSQRAQEAPGAPASADQSLAAPEAQRGDEEIEASLAEPAQPSPTTYLDDDSEDTRRLAPPERRCVEKTRDGRRCRSWALKGATMCAGHAGLGLVQDPQAHAALAHEARRQIKLTRQVVGNGGRLGPRAALRLAALQKGAALADRILAESLDPENGVAGANLALRTLDAVDPLVSVETTTSTGVELGQRLMAGQDVTFRELERVFGDKAQEPAPPALPA